MRKSWPQLWFLDIDECAGCGISGGYNPCPCSDPTPGKKASKNFKSTYY